MTYIVGLNMGGHTALIADTCVTLTDHNGTFISRDHVGASKTGWLFPDGGAIYALCGNYQEASEFIQNFKRELSNSGIVGTSTDALVKAWALFTTFVQRYRFPKGDFSLLISTRHLSSPSLYIPQSRGAML